MILVFTCARPGIWLVKLFHQHLLKSNVRFIPEMQTLIIYMFLLGKSSIDMDPLQPDAWQKIQLAEAERNKVPTMFVDTTPQQAPVFTSHLTSVDKLAEGQHVTIEAQVEPRADPNLRVEWFKNGFALTTGARIKSTFDFGHVSLSINGLRNDDSAIYTCKATNQLGEAVSTCSLKIEGYLLDTFEIVHFFIIIMYRSSMALGRLTPSRFSSNYRSFGNS
jgi:hypothetical protein